MIVVKNVFRLKYGQARPALAAFKEGRALMQKHSVAKDTRVMTDLLGPAYTMVMEQTYASLAEFEAEGAKIMGGPLSDEFRAWYQKFTPFVESGYREIYTLVE
jgi:hypothetical protein